MLFRKFKLLSFLGILVLVAAVTSGLSYWVFTDSSSTDSTNQSVSGSGDNHPAQSDGIFENYSFSKGELGDKYEFYFFPSTLYLELYSNGYEHPEDVFGYNEVQLDDNGNAIINDNGLAKYEVIGDDDDEKEHKIGLYLNKIYMEHRIAQKDNYFGGEYYRPNNWEDAVLEDVVINYDYDMSESDYGTPATDENSGITYYYKPALGEAAGGPFFGYSGNTQNRYWLKTEQVSTYYDFLTNSDVINNYSYYLNKDAQISETNGYQLFESYDMDNKDFVSKNSSYEYAFFFFFEQDPDGQLGINMDLKSAFVEISNADTNIGRFGKRRQYRNDRLGFWHGLYDLDDPNNSGVLKNQGFGSRYLPIKLTVTGSLNPNQLKHVLPPVMTSASDAYSFFNFYSNVWVYTDPKTGEAPYTTSQDGFTNKAQSSIFDIMKNPSLYATQEIRDGTTVNVIRLYPLFSSGSNDIGGENMDFVRVAYDYYDNYSGLDKIIAETAMTYSTDQIILSNDNNKRLKYLILNNVYLESGKYKSIQFNIGIRGLGGSYPSHKLASQYSNDSGTIYEGAIDKIISIYGEGYYTFYMVLKYPESDYGSIQGDLVGDKKNIITNSEGNGASGTFFNTLNRKNLIYSSTTSDGLIFNNAYSSDTDTDPTFCDINYKQHPQGDDSYYLYRPALLMFEKVTSLKMITNVPIPDNDNFTWSEIDDTINSVYDTSKTLINASGVYKATEDDFNNDGAKFSPADKIDLTVNNPYIYVIQNVDFRYVNSLYFQIRLGDHYVDNAMTIVTEVPKEQDQYIAFKYGKDQEGKDLYTIFASQSSLFSSKDNYFIQDVTRTSKDGVQRQGLKLKDTYAKGVYDIMLVGSSVEGNKYTFYMYINRHKLDFIKIFDENPGMTNVINGVTYNANFVNHYNSNTKANLIWQNNFYIGEVLTSSSTGSKGEGSEKLTILEAIEKSIETSIGPNTTDLFALKDAVTQQAIAYYKNGVLYGTNGDTSDGKSIDLFTLLKNYVLYIEEVGNAESGTTTEGYGEGVITPPTQNS